MIYENIAELAKEKGITINQLEREAGMGNGAIGKWKTSSPTIDSLVAVAKVLDVAVEVLIKGRGE